MLYPHSLLCTALPFQMSNDNLKDAGIAASIYDRERLSASGMDRLYMMFSVDEVGSFSPELISCCHAAAVGTFIGATYGGLVNTRNKPNDVTTQKQPRFKSGLSSRNVPEDGFAINFIRGGIHWGWRVGMFCGGLMLLTTATTVYRGKSGILEFALAGGVLGTAWSAKFGVRAVAVGGCLGTGVGALGGCAAYALHKMRGTTTEETRFWQYGWKETQLKHTNDLREENKKLIQQELEKAQNMYADLSVNEHSSE